MEKQRNEEDLLIDVFMGYEDVHLLPNLKSYKNEWNLLMPVVERIEVLQSTQVDIRLNYCRIAHRGIDFEGSAKTKIGAIYQVVVKFINWYNQNK